MGDFFSAIGGGILNVILYFFGSFAIHIPSVSILIVLFGFLTIYSLFKSGKSIIEIGIHPIMSFVIGFVILILTLGFIYVAYLDFDFIMKSFLVTLSFLLGVFFLFLEGDGEAGFVLLAIALIAQLVVAIDETTTHIEMVFHEILSLTDNPKAFKAMVLYLSLPSIYAILFYVLRKPQNRLIAIIPFIVVTALGVEIYLQFPELAYYLHEKYNYINKNYF